MTAPFAQEFDVNESVTQFILRPGVVLKERYRVEREIGRGGMGVIYKAHDTLADLPVALKVLPAELARDKVFEKALMREARILLQLTHSNIVRLHTIEREGPLLFLVEEYVRGFSLAEYLAERERLSPAEVRALLPHVVAALAAAHAQGVVHKDLKPGNIMLALPREAGEEERDAYLQRPLDTWPALAVKLMDFGIAQASRTRVTQLTGRMTSGTLQYMSPEQVMGETLDARSDIYSLGCVLYELLTGAPPFTTGDVTYQILHKEPRLPACGDEALTAVIAVALKKKPDERFATAEVLAEAVRGGGRAVHGHAEPAVRTAAATALPGWLVAVPDARRAPLENLAPGSAEAQQRQLETVRKTGLPLEVKTRVVGMRFRLIPPGSFLMGSLEDEEERSDSEGPQHRVTISQPFYVGVFEVTQDEWHRVMGTNPSRFENAGSRAPVERIRWDECQEFVRKLAELEGAPGGTFRLPTEAEWEYACRAGTTTRYYTGDSESDLARAAWFSAYKTYPVGQKQPNAWGLHDMHGNVNEWCEDTWHDNYEGAPNNGWAWLGGDTNRRVLRGGAWASGASHCRAADRSKLTRDVCFSSLGVRVVCVPRQ